MIAEVIVDVSNDQVDRIFDYIANEETQLGQRVTIPFGSRTIEGFVIGLKEQSNLKDSQLKQLGRHKDDYPVILPEFLALCEFMCQKFHLRMVDCLRLFIPNSLRNGKAKPLYVNMVQVCENYNASIWIEKCRKNATKQLELYEFLKNGESYYQTELNKRFGIGNINKLIDSGDLTAIKQEKLRMPIVTNTQDKSITLNEFQQKAINEICNCTEKPHLLFGVTGSGKTEVYMNVISKVLAEGKTAMLLVPEISLTPQMSSTFKARFGDEVAILHSRLSDGERLDEWQRLRLNKAKIVIGARSAVFAPMTNLGVIILDEEHDSSYKSESNPRFDTHQVAIFRAKYNNCSLVFGSATPSLESYYKAEKSEYFLHTLPFRANNKGMPHIQIINMCKEMREGNSGIFSRQLIEEMKNVILKKEQAMLFLNRRGFSSSIVCKQCGYVAKCEDCDVALVYHKEDEQLKCHYCNKRYKALTNCPNCKSDYIKLGAIGTQKVAEELSILFPNVKILRMDFDTTKNKNAVNNLLQTFGNTNPCILVGTQMIAKGHDFPNVTLVGLINADMGLHAGDFLSSEKTFQLVTQVSGRAGRAEKEGKVLLQTYSPQHYVYSYVANYDYLGFYKKEINLRETTNFPPFTEVVRVLISSESKDEARNYTAQIYNELRDYYLEHKKEILFCEAMASPITRIEKKFRFQILLRNYIEYADKIRELLYNVVENNKNTKVSLFIEVNPSSTI